jgi:hypothetical protein
MDNKDLLFFAFVLTFILVFGFLFKNVLVDKVTSNVIQELRRSYTPGPYDPGFDPDKVNPNVFRNN